ncbi:hypothetical protein HDG40_005658 [Paraburkholderia sp. JPY158]|uniref:Uncharacterized protein n=1 Tax=Paraburkholderia atlantica TaxID=2654982 RepID=A0A7W8V949_PARAM|nr:hypothetical protein [Paraburkholderia atlantica]MBB5427479.1 hypothetical protein [Paraburkholderia atlantica]
MTSDRPIIPARMSVDALKGVAADNGLQVRLTWQWVGRSRHGVLTVIKDDIPIFSERFARSTRVWGRGDETFDLVRTGSNKHIAVMHAVKSLQSLFAQPKKPVIACRRQHGGISDTLVD